ncbi:uncharacterized protein B0T15DRAFT_498439 [Chaetomium strumarium]|uniref:Zinc finger PHD-type domain-containing protein n=1 Tax=Chaetomium strumarium TaxID=1170767 RepID=A0AAJ0M653_9PEZI|nr:hypothetical protein B0T15DRAFT_498439 [Chaetomium strumarium]
MPATRKRPLGELDSGNDQQPNQPSMLHRIRNMWQFANLVQFIVLFGQALKLDDSLDIEDLEAECLKPGSMVLQDIGLGLLKFLSSHRGLTHELFDEYTRRQFLAKAPEKNPFGTAEMPAKFADFDVFTKIRVLHQMTQLIMMNPERLREKTEEQKDIDQTNWRIEPYGWDRQDRTYFVLDDNRLYRLTDAPPPAPKPKKNTKKARAAQRASKRRRVSSEAASGSDDAGDEASEAGAVAEPEDDGLGGMKWECVAVTLDDVRGFLSTIQKTKDANEKILRDQIQDHLLPILEKQEESRKRKQLQREKELLNLEKMAHAKRSSRIASKLEQQKMEERAREEERKRREEEAARRKEEQRRLKMERERDHRLMSREQRLKEREARRRLHQEELAQLSEDSRRDTDSAAARMSERRRLAEIERNKKALQELEEEEDDWIFDCVCGVYGQVDDGTHSVACERCNTWQHSKCLGINEQEADQDDFHFVCSSCRRREEEANDPHSRVIKIKVNRHQQSESPPREQAAAEIATPPKEAQAQLVVELQSGQSLCGPDGVEPLQARPSPSVQEADAAPSVERTTSNPLQETTKNNLAKDGVRAITLVQQSSVDEGNKPSSSEQPILTPQDGQSINSGVQKSAALDTTAIVTGDDDAQPGLVAKSAQSMGALSTLAGSGSGGSSPSKQPPSRPPPTKTSASVPATSNSQASPPPAENIRGMTSSTPIALPHLIAAQPREARSDTATGSSPLPPPSGGLSPTKHSPPVAKPQREVNGALPASGVHPFRPVAALSPSPRQQILTPPVKSAEPARVALSQQQAQGMQAAKLAPATSPRLNAQST